MKKIMTICAMSAALLSTPAVAQTPNTALNELLANPGGANFFSMDNLLSLQNDFTQSFTNATQALPALIAFGSGIQPDETLSAGGGIGTSLGLGIVTNTFPIVGVLLDNPAGLPDYLLAQGGIFSSFGQFSEIPAIPLFNAPIGAAPGGSFALPGLDGVSGLNALFGGGFGGFALPIDGFIP